jgi:uncharacterized coiled-coil protein SlyX
MPSLATRIAIQNLTLATAQEALTDAATAVAEATDELEALADGTLELEAVTIGGQRFINDGGALVAEP